MLKKTGRKSVYETSIKPRFDDITAWLQSGATEKQIASNLNVAYSTFNKYKAEIQEFSELLKNGRQKLVIELRGALVKKAFGYDYTETSVTKEADTETGEMRVVKTETKTKHAAPDVAALNLCLKNYDADNWANDPQALKLKEKELRLRREIADRDAW